MSEWASAICMTMELVSCVLVSESESATGMVLALALVMELE